MKTGKPDAKHTALAERSRTWYWSNHDKAIAKAKAWYTSERGKKVSRDWRNANKDHIATVRLARRDAWTAQGLCRGCGQQPREGHKRCAKCTPHHKPDPIRTRAQNLKRAYGITPEEWNAIFESQGRCCALCGTHRTGIRGWHTDHAHDTGRVRGILCGHCNKGLGFFRDNPALLSHAIDYLRKHTLTLVG